MKRPHVKRYTYDSNGIACVNIPSFLDELNLKTHHYFMLNEFFWALRWQKFCYFKNLKLKEVTGRTEKTIMKYAKEMEQMGYIVLDKKKDEVIIKPGEKLNEILEQYNNLNIRVRRH